MGELRHEVAVGGQDGEGAPGVRAADEDDVDLGQEVPRALGVELVEQRGAGPEGGGLPPQDPPALPGVRQHPDHVVVELAHADRLPLLLVDDRVALRRHHDPERPQRRLLHVHRAPGRVLPHERPRVPGERQGADLRAAPEPFGGVDDEGCEEWREDLSEQRVQGRTLLALALALALALWSQV